MRVTPKLPLSDYIPFIKSLLISEIKIQGVWVYIIMYIISQ